MLWWTVNSAPEASPRLPGADRPARSDAGAPPNPASTGRTIEGDGLPGQGSGAWPQFRGPERSGVNAESADLAHAWTEAGLREVWGVDCGEGYAGAVVRSGRVYLMDYDAEKKQNALRCLSLRDGKEIWRYSYAMALKRDHGMTRTVPVVTEKLVVAIDPKCNVLCVDARTGALRWSVDLVRQYRATVPAWYTGQCPLVDGNAVILAPGGPDALLLTLDLENGRPIWQTPNPHGWKMTHSSIMPMDGEGGRTYLYCASGGVVGVIAKDGKLSWECPDWKVSFASVPSPVVINEHRVFLSGGYNAGSAMLELTNIAGAVKPSVAFRLAPDVFGATQHTPILREGHLYGTRPNGQFVCLDLDGKVRWTSPAGKDFGLGPFLLAGDLFYVMNDSGTLTLLEATPEAYRQLGETRVLKGRESWGPMAMTDGHLLVRDFTRLACLDVSASRAAPASAVTR